MSTQQARIPPKHRRTPAMNPPQFPIAISASLICCDPLNVERELRNLEAAAQGLASRFAMEQSLG